MKPKIIVTAEEAKLQKQWETYEVPIAEAGILYGKDSAQYKAAVERRDTEIKRIKNKTNE